MSENEMLPAGWNAAVFPVGESWAWVAWQNGNKLSRIQGGATNETLAWDGARKLIAEQQKPPTPPAWMVEVAREANAVGYDAAKATTAAEAARAGERDHDIGAATAIRALRLALERRHVVEVRPVPSEEEMLRDAREDAAQVAEKNELEDWTLKCREGRADSSDDVKCALQARRNMLREWGAVAAPVVPAADLRPALTRAWRSGFKIAHALAMVAVQAATRDKESDADCDRVVSDILRTLPTREA